MRQNNRTVGETYEKIAGQYLASHGYQVLCYNYRCKQGEIDVIALDGDMYVFCEVKFRKDESKGHPSEAVTPAKQKRICRSAMVYLKEHYLWDVSCRFDVISILGEELTHIKNAFEMIGF